VPVQRLQFEVIRFALLLTVTVGLVAVATRAGHHGAASRAGGSHVSATSTTAASPATTGTTPATTGTSPATTRSRHHHRPPAGSSSGAGTATMTTLPRTGPQAATRLAGLAIALIALGTLVLRTGSSKADTGA
jgi:hypothetical protein